MIICVTLYNVAARELSRDTLLQVQLTLIFVVSCDVHFT